MSSDKKMKGLLKGLKFISQIFDSNEKEPEIEIGVPTDVKHVAHVGWDGPTENAPSWMNEYNSVPGLTSSAPLNMNGDRGTDDSEDWGSSDSIRRGGSRSMNLDENKHEVPLRKSSKNQSNSTGNLRELHAKEKSDKPRHSKKHSKHSTPNDTSNESKLTTTQQPIPTDTDSLQPEGTMNDNLPPKIQQDNSKKTHSKKTNDVQGVTGSSKSRSKSQVNEDGHSRTSSKSKDQNSNEEMHSRTKSREHKPKEGHPSRPNSKARTKHRVNEEDGELERESNEEILRSCPN